MPVPAIAQLLSAQATVTAPFDPSTISGLGLWLKADGTLWQSIARSTPATADGNPVGAWDDASSNARHFLAPADDTTRPTLKTGIVNGYPVLRFDGGDSLVRTAGFSISNYTLFVVAKRSSGDYTLVGSYNAGSPQFRIGQSGANKLSTYDGGNNPQSSTLGVDTTAAFSVLQFTRATSTVTFRQNGVSASTGTMSGAQIVSAVGRFDTSGNLLVGDMAEVLIYDSSLSTGDQNNVGGYLASKYGLSWTTI